MPSTEEKLSYDQVRELLKDPAEVRAAAARLGMKIAEPAQEKTKEEPKLEKPAKLVIPDDATPKQVEALINEYNEKMSNYYDARIARESSRTAGMVQESDQRRIAKEVQEFAAKHPKFKDLIADIEPIWKAGNSIADAYKKACKMNDINPETGKSITEREEPKASEARGGSKISNLRETLAEGETGDTVKEKKTSVRDRIGANLDALLAQDGNSSLLRPEDEEVG